MKYETSIAYIIAYLILTFSIIYIFYNFPFILYILIINLIIGLYLQYLWFRVQHVLDNPIKAFDRYFTSDYPSIIDTFTPENSDTLKKYVKRTAQIVFITYSFLLIFNLVLLIFKLTFDIIMQIFIFNLVVAIIYFYISILAAKLKNYNANNPSKEAIELAGFLHKMYYLHNSYNLIILIF